MCHVQLSGPATDDRAGVHGRKPKARANVETFPRERKRETVRTRRAQLCSKIIPPEGGFAVISVRRDRTVPGDRHASDQRDPEMELRSAEEINERPDDGVAVRRRWSYNGKHTELTRIRKTWGGSCEAEEKNLGRREKLFPRANISEQKKALWERFFFAEDLSNYELKMVKFWAQCCSSYNYSYLIFIKLHQHQFPFEYLYRIGRDAKLL